MKRSELCKKSLIGGFAAFLAESLWLSDQVPDERLRLFSGTL